MEPQIRRVRFTSVQGHRRRLMAAVYGTAFVLGLVDPWVWVK